VKPEPSCMLPHLLAGLWNGRERDRNEGKSLPHTTNNPVPGRKQQRSATARRRFPYSYGKLLFRLASPSFLSDYYRSSASFARKTEKATLALPQCA
jgi:hypothetical protein